MSKKRHVAKKDESINICITRENVEYCIDETCCPRNFRLGDRIGQGDYGVVFYATINEVTKVIKIIPLETKIPSQDCDLTDSSTWKDCNLMTEAQFRKEAGIAQLMGTNQVGPEVHNVIICKEGTEIVLGKQTPVKLGLLIMEDAGQTLRDYLNKNPNEFMQNLSKIKKDVKNLAKKMAGLGYEHIDTHLNNITINNEGTIRFIDFGEVKHHKGDFNKTYKIFEQTLKYDLNL
jgi:serine/threonine protein kinase